VVWVGRDRNGGGYVYRDIERQPSRISTVAVERALQSSTDLSGAVAFTYQLGGHTFYCLNAPGVASTWVYEVATQSWSEFADLDVYGEFEAWRVTHVCYCHGVHYAFDGDGNVYTLSESANTFAGDEIKRSRISPNDVTPTLDRQFFSEFALDCATGEAGQGIEPVVELSWSDDGGKTWGDPLQQSLGAVGNYLARVVWRRLGAGRDRVWRVDCASNAPFTIVNAEVRKA
jgi:hypothetical protein